MNPEPPLRPSLDGGIFSEKLTSNSRAKETESPVQLSTHELKKLLDEVRRSDASKAEIIQFSPECIAALDASGIVTEFNPASVQTFGIPRADVLGSRLEDLIIPERQRVAFKEMIESLRSGDLPDGTRLCKELTAFRPDGSNFTMSAVIVRHPGPRPAATTLFMQDLSGVRKAESAQRELEARFRQVQKMEAVGTLAAGIAHDFNNILGAVISFSELAKLDAADNTAVQGSLSEILRASLRARDLIQQMLTFSRQNEHQMIPARLQEDLLKSVPLLRAAVPPHITFSTSIRSDVPEVLVDAAQIQLVLVNLITNSVQALGATPGRIDLSYSAVPPGVAEGENPAWTRLAVTDDGPGIPTDTAERIFDPFFTTKEPGAGTGLGLAVVHGIVEEHSGRIEVSSTPGQDTTFEIFLPVHDSNTLEGSSVRETDELGHGESILVVDDELPLVKLAISTLERNGFRCVGASSVTEAIARFSSQPARFDLILTDMAMPRETGIDLARRVRAIRRDIPLILWTAQKCPMEDNTAHELGFHSVLSKPTHPMELARSIRTALDSPAEQEPQPSTF